MPIALLLALKEVSMVKETLARSGIRVVVVSEDPAFNLPAITPEDIALVLADTHTEAVGRAQNEVALKPRRPRVKRKGKGLLSPKDHEREWREKEKRLTKFSGKKAAFFNRKIGNKK